MSDEKVVGPRPRVECNLIGAPGSKKTETAILFEEASRGWFAERNVMPLSIVDTNNQLTDRQGRDTGVKGDHYATLANYFNRAAMEDVIRARGDSYITCGTVVDSIAHLNARLKLLSQMVQLPNTQAMAEREMLVGQLLQTYIMDGRWQVSFAWYLPLPDKIVLPGVNSNNESTYDAEVDAILRDINLKMQLNIPVLVGTPEQKVEKMMADLDTYYQGVEEVDGEIDFVPE